MKGKLFVLALCSCLCTSCLSSSIEEDIIENETVRRFYEFTDKISKQSVDGPVSALNGLDDKTLSDTSLSDEKMKGCGASFSITCIRDSVWRAESLMDGITFVTEVTLLPEESSILGIKKHTWSARTEGYYVEDLYAAPFRSVSDFNYYWFAADSGDDEVRVRMKRKGTFQIETSLDGMALDSAELTLAGSVYSFKSTLGTRVGVDEPF